MSELRTQITELGYPTPPKHLTTDRQLNSYVQNLTLADLSLKALQTLARSLQISTDGSKDVLLQRLVQRNVSIPPLVFPQSKLSLVECTSWSQEYREAFARWYGIKFDRTPLKFCRLLVEGVKAMNNGILDFEVQIGFDRPERIITTPLSPLDELSLTIAELKAIARHQGIAIRDRTKLAMYQLLNRVIPAGTNINLNHEPLLLPPTRLRTTVGRTRFCENTDVKQVYLRYQEGAKSYCFAESDLPTLRTTFLNPYTGRPLSDEFIQSLGLNRVPFDLPSICTECSTNPCYNYTDLSEFTLKWLRRWMEIGVFDQYHIVYRIDPYVRLELAKFKQCTPVTVYRGLSFQKHQYREFQEAISNSIYTTITLTSWTGSKQRAINYASDATYQVIMKATIQPIDIFVDTRLFPDQLYQVLDVSNQAEVIVLPGSYQIELSSIE